MTSTDVSNWVSQHGSLENRGERLKRFNQDDDRLDQRLLNIVRRKGIMTDEGIKGVYINHHRI